MNIDQVSFGFTTNKGQETKEFYGKYLGAITIFEKDGCACLKFGDISNILSIEAPQSPEDKPSDSIGLGLGVTVDDVDLAYDEIVSKKLNIGIPLEDHSWGERGFGIKDPNGLAIYIIFSYRRSCGRILKNTL